MEGEGHIFHATEAGKQVEELKNESDFVAAEAGEIVVGESGDVVSIDADFACGGAVEAAD